MFSKFLPGQRDSQLLLDSDNFTYSRNKDTDKDTPLNTAWRCSKNRSPKCHAMVYLDTNNALSQGSKPHNHAPDNLIKEKSIITATQNIVSEVLEGASKDLYIHRGADMTYVGMHTNIADSCAPGPTTAPLAPTAAPLTPTTAPLYIWWRKGRSCPVASLRSRPRVPTVSSTKRDS